MGVESFKVQKERTEAFERRLQRITPHVFQRDGRRRCAVTPEADFSGRRRNAGNRSRRSRDELSNWFREVKFDRSPTR